MTNTKLLCTEMNRTNFEEYKVNIVGGGKATTGRYVPGACGGEMEKKGRIIDILEEPVVTATEYRTGDVKTLYQCKLCKNITIK